MKSPEEALCAEVEKIASAIYRGQYRVAASAASNLTRVAYSLDSIDDVFIGEVMSVVCGHVDYVVRSYYVDKENMDVVHAQIAAYMDELVANHKKQQNICHILQQIRYVATTLALDAEQDYPPRTTPSAEQGRQA